ncbi:MAG: hypothetical protein AAGF11_35205 [Myxococcota bacterium]
MNRAESRPLEGHYGAMVEHMNVMMVLESVVSRAPGVLSQVRER